MLKSLNNFILISVTFFFISMDVKVGIVSNRKTSDIKIIPVNDSSLVINGKEIKNKLRIFFNKRQIIRINCGDEILEFKNIARILINGTASISNRSNQRYYRGIIDIEIRNNSLFMINTIDLEDYVLSVLESEAQNVENFEAMKANAVAIRTYAIAAKSRHIKDGYNFCDLTHCQFYRGFKNIRDITYKAVNETKGIIMEYKGVPIWAMYHSVCGGRTEDAYDVWGYDTMPYLKSVRDTIGRVNLCSEGFGYRWITKISIKRFDSFVKKIISKNRKEKFLNIKNIIYSKSGRVLKFDIVSDKKKYTLSGVDFYHIAGRSFGWLAIKSTAFEVKRDNKYIIFNGRGYGHGVGMCQAGAEKMGELGFDYKKILKHYYSDIKFVKLY